MRRELLSPKTERIVAVVEDPSTAENVAAGNEVGKVGVVGVVGVDASENAVGRADPRGEQVEKAVEPAEKNAVIQVDRDVLDVLVIPILLSPAL
jgi:hypothetical protein